jgi:type II secretory pathway predicted ATPase ExeA
MYERFYGLSRTPFAVTPDPAMLFMSKVHREALATIIYGVETRKGFIVCTGEVGTGKSTIVRAFFDQVRGDAVKLIYIFTPQVTPLQMSQYVCGELGLAEPDSVFAAVPRLQLRLLEEFERERTVVLMIDEAQLLPPETLEFLRLLSNFETDTEKLIQIVLVGQPEVDVMLARRDMRQVNQRVALRARLTAFGIEESFAYVEHRLRLSGAGELTQVMTPSAAWLIAEASGGIPRVINILADNALIAGFGAAQRPLGSQLAGKAVRDFVTASAVPGPTRPPPLAFGWRVARRLRNALARERGEPDDFVAAAPAPPALPPNRVVVTPAVPRRNGGGPSPRPAAPAVIMIEPVAPPPPEIAEAVAPSRSFRPPPSLVGFDVPAPIADLPPMIEPTLPAPVPGPYSSAPTGNADRSETSRAGLQLARRPAPLPPVAPAVLQAGRWPALLRVRAGLQAPGPVAMLGFDGSVNRL